MCSKEWSVVASFWSILRSTIAHKYINEVTDIVRGWLPSILWAHVTSFQSRVCSLEYLWLYLFLSLENTDTTLLKGLQPGLLLFFRASLELKSACKGLPPGSKLRFVLLQNEIEVGSRLFSFLPTRILMTRILQHQTP